MSSPAQDLLTVYIPRMDKLKELSDYCKVYYETEGRNQVVDEAASQMCADAIKKGRQAYRRARGSDTLRDFYTAQQYFQVAAEAHKAAGFLPDQSNYDAVEKTEDLRNYLGEIIAVLGTAIGWKKVFRDASLRSRSISSLTSN